MENCETHDPANEFEIVEMFRVDAGMRIDLESVVVVCGIFEETVERIEHFVREQEEELPGKATVIKTVFAVELDHQSFLQIGGTLSHDFGIRVLEDVASSDFNMTLSRQDS
jgi:hypothetical protein